MKILITGGAGMIGSSLAKQLIALNHDITIIDNLWRGKLEYLTVNNEIILPDPKIIIGDLTDINFCKKHINDFDLVYHLADIVAGINYVFANQYEVWSKNILINTNVINTSISNGINKLIYVGTACSYPKDKQMIIGNKPFVETDAYPAQPESSYGWSKLMGEYELLLAEESGLINASILRLHNVYGPPCETNIKYSQVIPALCKKAINYPNEPFVVWGTGKQRRAFVYIDDVIDALISTIEFGFNGGVIQIGPNTSESIADVADHIVKISNKNINIEFDTTKPEGDLDRSADFTKAKNILNWKPKVGIFEGLSKTYEWISKN